MKFKLTTTRPNVDASRRISRPSIAYVDLKENVMDNLVNRFDRPWKLWKQGVIDTLKAEGVNVESVSWSQKAGCRCGCSPGFKIKGAYGNDYWIKVTGTPVVEPDSPRVAARARAIGKTS